MNDRRSSTPGPGAMPMDAYREGDNFYICLDLPGVSPESIELTVEQNVLTERAPAQAAGAELIGSERPVGTFSRQVFLGETLDPDHIGADYAGGVLTLTIPVHPAAKPRSIQVTNRDRKQAVTSRAWMRLYGTCGNTGGRERAFSGLWQASEPTAAG